MNSGNGWFRKTQKKETVFGISSISDLAAMLPRALKNQFLGLIRAASQSSGGGRIVDRGGSRTTLQLSNCCCSTSTTNAFYANDLANLECENPQMVRGGTGRLEDHKQFTSTNSTDEAM